MKQNQITSNEIFSSSSVLHASRRVKCLTVTVGPFYQDLAILLVDGDHAALCGALLVGLFDADVSDIRKVAPRLQFLSTNVEQKTTL